MTSADDGPLLTRSPTKITLSRSFSYEHRVSSIFSSSKQPCTSPTIINLEFLSQLTESSACIIRGAGLPWMPAFNTVRCAVELHRRFSDARKIWKLPTVESSVAHVIIMNKEKESIVSDSASFSQLVRAIMAGHAYASTSQNLLNGWNVSCNFDSCGLQMYSEKVPSDGHDRWCDDVTARTRERVGLDL